MISLILLTDSLDRKYVTSVYVYINDMLTVCIIVRVISVENEFISEERFVLELPTSCTMLATARHLFKLKCAYVFGEAEVAVVDRRQERL